MNLHPECRATPCSHDHRCRPPESVQIPPGVDESRIMGVRLKPGYPGGNNGIGIGGGGGVAGGAPVQDPLESDWHQQLVCVVVFLSECWACWWSEWFVSGGRTDVLAISMISERRPNSSLFFLSAFVFHSHVVVCGALSSS